MSNGKEDAFAETISYLVTIHRREVTHLREQVHNLRSSLAKLQVQAATAQAGVAGKDAEGELTTFDGSFNLEPSGAGGMTPGAAPDTQSMELEWHSVKEAIAMPSMELERHPIKEATAMPSDEEEQHSVQEAMAVQGLQSSKEQEAAVRDMMVDGTSATNLIRWRVSGRMSTATQPHDEEEVLMTASGRPLPKRHMQAAHRHTDQKDAHQILAEAAKYQTSAAKRMNKVARKSTWRTSTSERMSLTSLINHPIFDTICAVMIIFNSVLVGVNVERGTYTDEEAVWTIVSGHICSAFFLVELLLRMYSQGRDFYNRENRSWNFFDMLLVFSSIVDFVLNNLTSGGGAQTITRSTGSILKIFKMLRIVRVFRVFRFFRELALLALLIVDSMCSLLWALLLLIMVIYVFAIWFTLQASDFLKEGRNDYMATEVHRQFGSLGRTVYSLVQAMLGGVSWGVVSDALFAVDWFTAGLFFFYISFCVLAVLNIITGVFVDNAFETARMQREFLVQKEMELREKYIVSMRALFEQMDADHSGSITLDEVQASFEDSRVQCYFQALGLDPEDLERLFMLLDDDKSGELNLDEFLSGCLRLKGQARSIDVHALIMQVKKLEADQEERYQRLEKSLIHGDSHNGHGRDEEEEGMGIVPTRFSAVSAGPFMGPVSTMSF